MEPQGIEPCPLVLQTSVRTSYTKAPYVEVEGLEPPSSKRPDLQSGEPTNCSTLPLCRRYRIRTYDPLDVNQMLLPSELISYLAGEDGFEPTTFELTVHCSTVELYPQNKKPLTL